MTSSLPNEGPRPARTNAGLLWIVALLLVVVLGIALLYAYRAQPPAHEAVPYGRVLTELQEGQLRSVVIEGDRATVTLADGRTQQAATPGDDQLTRAILERNRADPAHAVTLRYQQGSPSVWLPLMMGMGLLPLSILIALIVLAASLFIRSSRTHRYEHTEPPGRPARSQRDHRGRVPEGETSPSARVTTITAMRVKARRSPAAKWSYRTGSRVTPAAGGRAP